MRDLHVNSDNGSAYGCIIIVTESLHTHYLSNLTVCGDVVL